MKTTMVVLGCVVGCAVAPAIAQPTHGGWLIEVVGDPVSPSNPTTTVRVSAYFPPNLWAFNGGGLDIIGNDLTGSFVDAHLPPPVGPLPPPPFRCVLFSPGVSIPGGVIDIGFGQINIVGCLAHPANPLPIFEATWSTSDFRPRQVTLETHNTPAFHVFPYPGATLEFVDLVALNQFRHGSAVIQVIPAPSVAALLLAASGAAPRRRRQRNLGVVVSSTP